TIGMGADFYSNGVLVEIPGDHRRLTDLERVQPLLAEDPDWLHIRARLPLGKGILHKEIAVHLHESRVRLAYHLDPPERPMGIVRVGNVTLFSDSMSLPLYLQCHNGGAEPEAFLLEAPINHGLAASSLVSSRSGLGATEGTLTIHDDNGCGATFRWRPDRCAALPMLTHEEHHGKHFTRLSFSLSELDDTSRSGGCLLPFSFDLLPYSMTRHDRG
ncbi:MAG: hypothetical protein D6720_11195, partial [Gammaproteobacteria bacterium]